MLICNDSSKINGQCVDREIVRSIYLGLRDGKLRESTPERLVKQGGSIADFLQKRVATAASRVRFRTYSNFGYGNPMSWNPNRLLAVMALTVLATGCYPTRPMYLRDTGDLSYYLEKATDIEYPDIQTADLEEVTQARDPITVIDPDFDAFMDLTLEQCVSMALQNAKVLRGYGTPNLQQNRVSPGIDTLANGPAAAGTIYNVAIRQSEPGFIGTPGQLQSPGNVLTNTGLDVNQGVESALADFDCSVYHQRVLDELG